MKTFQIRVHDEREEQVLRAFLDSLQYEYRLGEEPDYPEISEARADLIEASWRAHLDGSAPARTLEEIEAEEDAEEEQGHV